MNNKMLTIFVSIIVAGVVVGASLPIFASFTTSKETHTNDGAGWIRFNYDANASEYEISLTESEDGITITNGSDTQTYSADSPEEFNTILYADTNLSVWVDDDNIHVLGLVDGSPVYIEGWGDFTISRTADGVTFGDNDYNVTFDAPTWAYVPWSSGSYGFFTPSEEGVVTYPADMPNAIVGGGFAGVYAYNDIYRYDGLGLVMTPTYNGDNLTGAGWAKPSVPFDPQQITITPLDPSVISGGDVDIQPIDPITIDPDPDVSIMTLPTPTYTDGDWGYEIATVSGVQKAVIVAYLGTGGDVVVPATIGGYDVYQLGNNNVSAFDNSTLAPNSTLTISNGVVRIGEYAVKDVTNFTGALTFPNSITGIGARAFNGCTGLTSVVLPKVTTLDNYVFSGCTGLTGSLVIPETVKSIFTEAFSGCTGLTGSLVIPESVTYYGGYSFRNCKFTNVIISSNATPNTSTFSGVITVSELLDLSTVDYSSAGYGMNYNTATVQDNIGDCFGFISVVSYTTGGDSTPTQTIIAMLPLVMVAGLVIMAVVMLIYKKI